MVDKREVDQRVDEYEASRPGPKTLIAVILVGLCVTAFYNWSDITAALDFI